MGSGRIRFFVSGREKEISPGSELWHCPLSGKVSASKPQSEITIGEYLSAAAAYLAKNDFSDLHSGIDSFLNSKNHDFEIRDICLYLEKHGAFYHPIKVSVYLDGGKNFDFVLNGAVASPGLSLIESEYRYISKLNQEFQSYPWLPQLFGFGMVETGRHQAGFFLGQWFDGFREFHISRHLEEEKIVLWHSAGSVSRLPMSDALPIYREIAFILTSFYNIETFDQILSWHHAAGDFIVKFDENRVQVRLITVRGYGSLIEFDPEDDAPAGNIFTSLLVFFLNLSVRMRLDRLDGTGEPVFMDEGIVMETVKGFFRALDTKSQQPDYKEITQLFKSFFSQFDADQLFQIAKSVIESHSFSPGELELVRENLAAHCRILHAFFNSMK